MAHRCMGMIQHNSDKGSVMCRKSHKNVRGFNCARAAIAEKWLLLVLERYVEGQIDAVAIVRKLLLTGSP
ncbi:MAG: hypothetical protein QOI24_1603 [Acidobacteriota bacterium]|jgi:hypothetical protein|nr:hypothetical protein [Acidobacteriota bacterium]